MLSAEQTRLAYQLLLGREPGPEELGARQASPHSLGGLADALIGGDEYKSRTDSEGGALLPYLLRDRRVGPYPFDFLVADRTGHEWYGGITEFRTPELDWCLSHIGPGMTVLDCGAHHGLMSIAFSKA